MNLDAQETLMPTATDRVTGGIARRRFLAASAVVTAAVAGGLGAASPPLSPAAPRSARLGSHDASATGTPEQPAPGDTVSVERLVGGVLLVGIDRPTEQNRIDPATFVALGRAYALLDQDDDLRVAVLFGHGPDFSAGIDAPAWAPALGSGAFDPGTGDFVDPLGITLPRRAKPVVVAVQGITQFMGHELFLAADVRVAASDTVFNQGEATRGAFPAGGGTVRFVREAGWANAMRYMLTGEEWGADDAFRLGLVQMVTPPGDQLDRALEYGRKIARAAPLGVRATLASAHRAQADGEDAAFAALLPEFGRLLRSEDRQEYLRALSENRPPSYRGR
ncbi:MAG TPA: crotonase/enoyl-CoA hydratase family protein [Chloroflexota bacterium]|jgi:enoyl-CoA hydratase/carnithine racemase